MNTSTATDTTKSTSGLTRAVAPAALAFVMGAIFLGFGTMLAACALA
jgi:hypothetical protein